MAGYWPRSLLALVLLSFIKTQKRKRGQYLAILTELAWSIKDLSYCIKRTCLFSSTEKEASYMQK